MGRVSASVVVGAPLADTWERYFDPEGWAMWVDGFAAVEAAEGYPATGGELRWRSLPAGRGTVTERVLEHEPRRLHRVAFADSESEGELVTSFAIEPGGEDSATRVTQELAYRLRRRGPIVRLADAFFVRGQLRHSLERSLTRFRYEAEDAAVEAPPPA